MVRILACFLARISCRIRIVQLTYQIMIMGGRYVIYSIFDDNIQGIGISTHYDTVNELINMNLTYR